MKLSTFLIPFIILSLSSVAQKEFVVRGLVSNEKNIPLENVHVQIGDTHSGFMTRTDGTFEFVIDTPGPVSLTFSHVSYETKVLDLNVSITPLELGRIKMASKVYNYSDIIIHPNDSAETVLKKVFLSLRENYHPEPALIEVLYANRELRYWAEKGKPEWRMGLTRAYFIDDGWTEQYNYTPDKDKMLKLLENEFYYSDDDPYRKWWKSSSLPVLIGKNIYQYQQGFCLPPSERGEINMIINDSLSSEEFVVVDFVIKKHPIERHYILRKDSKIMRIETYYIPESTSKSFWLRGFIRKKSFSLSYDTTIINYQTIKDKVYLKDISRSIYSARYDLKKDSVLGVFNYNYLLEFNLINSGVDTLPDTGSLSKFYKNLYDEKCGERKDELSFSIPGIMHPDSLEAYMMRLFKEGRFRDRAHH